MPLFQQSVLNKYLGELNKEQVFQAYRSFQNHFHDPAKQANILQAKEEQYQEGFLSELFGSVLGYTLYPKPQYNIKTEHKNEKDSKKADGAIFNGDKVRAVIELKGTDTIDLGKVENQAFSYKNNQQGCDYVVTSNFQKLRFYVKDATDFDEFDLFTLSIRDFERLYLYLHKDQLLNDVPLKLMQTSVMKEQEVTKALYKDYSQFKRKLFNNLMELNSHQDKLTLFKKTQKLLDRFLFILFGEDRGLLPPNAVSDIIKDYQQLKELDNYVPLYTRFRKYFGYLNTGYKHKDYEIFAYNGGLFAEDDVLDILLISDEVLQEGMLSLSKYDFISEVDVNILGHIFEHSLNEIEEIQAELEGRPIDKGKTKRKKDGVFYTPKYITKYIVDNTVGALCKQKKEELSIIDEEYAPIHKKANKRALNDKLEFYRTWLLQITILDPACGSGAFLNQALDFLIEEHRKVDELRASLFGDAMVLTNLDNEILEHNIYGVDINEESIEIAKLSLWLRTAKKGRKLSSLNYNIKCGNTLIDDTSIAGDKAFIWQKEFPDILLKGGFDIILGNPPYGILLSDFDQSYFRKHFPLTSYKINLYVLFIERMFQLFDCSIISFIIPKSLLFNSYYSHLRQYLLTHSQIIEIFSITEKVFEDAEVGGSLIVNFKINKSKNNNEHVVHLISVKSFSDLKNNEATLSTLNQAFFLNIPNYEISIVSDEYADIKNKLLKLLPLKSYYKLKNGLNPGNIKHILIGKKKDSLKHKPIIWGKDIKKYNIEWSGDYINYDENIAINLTLDDTKSKAGMKSQSKIDFALREPSMFEVEKVLVRKTGDSLIAAYDRECNYYFDTLVHGIYCLDKAYSLNYILAILNSKPATIFYRLLHDIKGKVFAKISLDNLASFPLPELNVAITHELENYAKKLIELNENLNKAKSTFLTLCKTSFPELNLNKISMWHMGTFEHFNNELKKQGIILSLQAQKEWIHFFNKEKNDVQIICSDINSINRSIDVIVYKVYGITKSEIEKLESISIL